MSRLLSRRQILNRIVDCQRGYRRDGRSCTHAELVRLGALLGWTIQQTLDFGNRTLDARNALSKWEAK